MIFRWLLDADNSETSYDTTCVDLPRWHSIDVSKAVYLYSICRYSYIVISQPSLVANHPVMPMFGGVIVHLFMRPLPVPLEYDEMPTFSIGSAMRNKPERMT